MNILPLKLIVGLHRNVAEVDKKTAKIVNEYGLTITQFSVLEALYSKGEMTVGAVQKKILSSTGTIPLVVNNLVKMGLVERFVNEKDRRQCILKLTGEGHRLISIAAPVNEEMLTEHFSVLTENEQEQLSELLKKLGGN